MAKDYRRFRRLERAVSRVKILHLPSGLHDSCYFPRMVQRHFFAFCKSLQLIELKAIGSHSPVKHFADNEIVYSSGDEGRELFIITRGAVELIPQNARPGSPATVLSRGDIFGESGALMELPRNNTARACGALSVQCFRRSDFPELMQRVPSFFLF